MQTCPGEKTDYDARFNGIKRLVGAAAQERLRKAHVCVIGVGGVGSWVVEALARSGIGVLTLIDLDEVCVSNVNRQLPALTSEVGKPKVQAMKLRVAGINPDCAVYPIEEFRTPTNAERVLSGPYDYLVDAIDTLQSKALLIATVARKKIRSLQSAEQGAVAIPLPFAFAISPSPAMIVSCKNSGKNCAPITTSLEANSPSASMRSIHPKLRLFHIRMELFAPLAKKAPPLAWIARAVTAQPPSSPVRLDSSPQRTSSKS